MKMERQEEIKKEVRKRKEVNKERWKEGSEEV